MFNCFVGGITKYCVTCHHQTLWLSTVEKKNSENLKNEFKKMNE